MGEQDIDLIRANDADSGTISNSTFQGGTIEVFDGPWTITGNTVLGSTADTYSPGASASTRPTTSSSRITRCRSPIPPAGSSAWSILAGSGFDNTIQDNTFGGGAGQVGNEVSYDPSTDSSGASTIRRSSWRRAVTASCSKAGRVRSRRTAGCWSSPISEPPPSVDDGPGDGGLDPRRRQRRWHVQHGLAGQWFPVAQQVSLSGDTIELLMQIRCPRMPRGLLRDRGHRRLRQQHVHRQHDRSDRKSSTGIDLDGEDYGTVITGNHFIGGTIYDSGYNGTAISLGARIASAPSGDGSNT